MMSNDNIKIRIVKPEDYTKVVEFMIEYFYRDEPLCNCEPKTVPGDQNRNSLLHCLQYNCSIMAVQKTADEEELVGVNIAEPAEPSTIEKYFEMAKNAGLNTKTGQIRQLLSVASRQADVFNRYGVDKIFYSFMTCVKPSARGKNLGTRLKQELMTLAKSLDYKLLTADCTSFYSAKVLERLGWDCVNFIPYKDYVDENNKQIFNPSAPHTGVKTFAVRL